MAQPNRTTYRNLGARGLAATGLSLREIGRRVGVSRESPRRWLAGTKVPEQLQREVLLREFGIHPTAWDMKDVEASPTPDVESPEPVDAPLPDTTELDTTLAQIRTALRAPGLTHEMLVKLSLAETRAIAQRERLRAAAIIDDCRIAGSPQWARAIELLIDCIEGAPLALLAVQIIVADTAAAGGLTEDVRQVSAQHAAQARERLADVRSAHPTLVADVERANRELDAAIRRSP